uniref:BRCA1-associated protein n=1 Tax=Kalanchoe fedtschenkoi TaxID=63787 RepID=A0A7N0ZQZ2_KALFE
MAAADDLTPTPSLATADDDDAAVRPSSSSSKFTRTQAFAFSSGNPRIEETRGLIHLFTQHPSDSSASDLPSGRKPLVCVLGVPNHMTYADFCQFCGSFIHNVLEMRIVRKDGEEDRYSILMRFDNQDSADSFYGHFNGRQFSSLEAETCHMLFAEDIQYTDSIEHIQPSPTSSSEQPTCPVCLERLDQDASGILTTICNHSFHCSCISLWTDSSCPVCRYCQQQPEKSICFICQTSENLWICVICGFVGCGRYKEGHAIRHWKETQHCYSLEVETQRVWDYVGDNYVHRLIQSKTDGKLVALNSRCLHADDGCGSCECSADNDINEVLLNSKVEAIVNEYNVLLCTQLENQKLYFEGLLQDIKDETDKEISEAVEKAVMSKLQKMQAKLDKCIEEKKFLDQINESLLKNQELWKAKLLEIEERERKACKVKDDRIRQLEEQLQDLMGHIEVGNAIEQHPLSNDIKDGTVFSIQAGSPSLKPTKSSAKARR